MKKQMKTVKNSLKSERIALVNALISLTQLYNEKLVSGSVDYVEKFERARAKLEQLKSKVNLTGRASKVDSARRKSRRESRESSRNSTEKRPIKHMKSFTGQNVRVGGAIDQNFSNISMAVFSASKGGTGNQRNQVDEEISIIESKQREDLKANEHLLLSEFDFSDQTQTNQNLLYQPVGFTKTFGDR